MNVQDQQMFRTECMINNYTGFQENICTRCSRIYGSCCVAAPGCESHPTFVSDYEFEIIRDHISSAEDFFIAGPDDTSFIQFAGSLFPEFPEDTIRAFSPGGAHRSLKIDCFGRCSMLGEEGCILPYDVRPLFCRIYPFWYLKGELKLFTNERCLAMYETSDTEKLMELFRTDRKQLELLYRMLLLSWLGREKTRQ